MILGGSPMHFHTPRREINPCRQTTYSMEENLTMSDVTVVNVPTYTVLGMRKQGHYRDMAQMLPALCMFAATRGIQMTGPPIFVMHETTPEEAIAADAAGTADIEVALPVAGKARGEGEITLYVLPGGTMARIVHKGPYEACKPTYLKLYAWIEQNHKKISGPIREVYLNDPREVGPAEILTEIYAPISG